MMNEDYCEECGNRGEVRCDYCNPGEDSCVVCNGSKMMPCPRC
jgi:hypothetical protein